jgi:hypothetical protein
LKGTTKLRFTEHSGKLTPLFYLIAVGGPVEYLVELWFKVSEACNGAVVVTAVDSSRGSRSKFSSRKNIQRCKSFGG